MKAIILALRLIWKRKYTYLILVIQMILSLIIFISLVGKVQNIAKTKEITTMFNDENAFYFTPYTYYDTNYLNLAELLSDVPGNFQFGKIASLSFTSENGDPVFAYGYNDTIICYTNLKLSDGEWFDDQKTYDHIPLIAIGNRYSIGDMISLKDFSKNEEITGEIIGKLEKDEYIAAFMSGGSKNHASIENIVSTADADFIVPFECEHLPSIKEDDITNFNYNYGTIVIADPAIHNEIYEALDTYGEVSDISSMIANYADNTRDYFLANGIVLLVFTLLGVAGIGGINSMLSVVNRRRYTIYYLCGMTSKTCAAIEAARSGIMIAVSYLAVVLIFCVADTDRMFPPVSYTINFLTFVYALLYMISIYMITSFYFVIDLKRQNLIEAYKQKA